MTTPTKDELLTEWVAALRSGEYQQGRDVLHNEEQDTYCCLGVACDVLTKKGLLYAETTMLGVTDANGQREIPVTAYFGDDGERNDQLLPNEACRLLGLSVIATDEDEDGNHSSYEQFIEDPDFNVMLPNIDDDGESPALRAVSSLNDTYHFTFEQIADLIEQQMLGKVSE